MTTINMGKIFTNEMKSELALLALGGYVKTYTMDDVKNYRDAQSSKCSFLTSAGEFLSNSS